MKVLLLSEIQNSTWNIQFVKMKKILYVYRDRGKANVFENESNQLFLISFFSLKTFD